MAAKKTRKRAYIPPSSEVVNRRERSETTTRTHRSSAPRAQRGGAAGRREYVYPTPSWGRTLKRLPVYFVMIFALQYLLGGDASRKMDQGERLLFAAGSAAFVTVLFAPFMHMMDRFAYNRYLKRSGGVVPGASAAPAPAPRRDNTVEGHVLDED